MKSSVITAVQTLVVSVSSTLAFQLSPPSTTSLVVGSSLTRTTTTTPLSSSLDSQRRMKVALEMAADSESGSKKKRRKRKTVSPDADAPSSATSTATSTSSTASTTASNTAAEVPKKESAKDLVQQLLAQEQMMYDQDDEDLTSFIPQKLEQDDRIAAAASKAGFSISDNSNNNMANDILSGDSQLEDLFDSREFLTRKREKQLADLEKEGKPSSAIPTKKKIKRSDVKAYTKLLEMDPLADEDSSYFEDEGGVDFISALLGDVEPGVGVSSDEDSNKSGKGVQKKTSFLGIGSGPLQVGHFIGALGVVLMAFVEYPGFPLTNLPDPLRGALQGGELPCCCCRICC